MKIKINGHRYKINIAYLIKLIIVTIFIALSIYGIIKFFVWRTECDTILIHNYAAHADKNYDNSINYYLTETKSESLNEKESEETVRGATGRKYTEYSVNDNDALILAKTAWGEARGCSITEQSCIMWCILNRADNWNMSIYEVATQPNQFYYEADFPTISDEGIDLVGLAKYVLEQHWFEENNMPANRTLPKQFMWYWGDGEHNYFRDAFNGNFNEWDFSINCYYQEIDENTVFAGPQY